MEYAFCQALYKGIEGEDWEEMRDSYKEMSRAVGVKKPQEAQKAKALWAMKAAKDRKEQFYNPTREEDNSRRNKTRLEFFGEEHLKDSIAALVKHENALKVMIKVGSRPRGSKAAMTSDRVVSELISPL